MKRSPVQTHHVNKAQMQTQLQLNLISILLSPSITVRCVYIYTKVQQEFDNVVMSCTHCIM